MRKTGLLAAILLLAASGFFAQAPARTDSPGLGGTAWRLVQFRGGDDTILTPADPAKYTLEFGADGRLAARIDCNRGSGAWKSAGKGQIELGPLAMTRAMCPPATLSDRIARDLSFVRSYLVRDGHLFLSLMADGGIYELEPMNPGTAASGKVKDTAASLEGTTWRLIRLGKAPVTATSPRREPHLILDRGSRRVGGSGGCNRLSGSYDLRGDRLSFSRLTATMMACIDGMETEKAFLGALGRAKKWRIAGQQLELFDAADKMLARFQAGPAPVPTR